MARAAAVSKELNVAIGELDEISAAMRGKNDGSTTRDVAGSTSVSKSPSKSSNADGSSKRNSFSSTSPETKKDKLPKNLPISKKSQFWFLPPRLEKQLTDSRTALERQKKAFDDTFHKLSSIEKKKMFK